MTTPTSASPRQIQIGAHRIIEDASTAHYTAEQIRSLLRTQYPEVAHATVREYTSPDGQRVLSFMAQPGRKG